MTNSNLHCRLAAAVVVTAFAAGVVAPVHSAEANRRGSVVSARQAQQAKIAAGAKSKLGGPTSLSGKATTSAAPAKVAAKVAPKAKVNAKVAAKATKRMTAKQFAGRVLATAFASFVTVGLTGLTAKMGGIAEGIFRLAMEQPEPAALVAFSACFAVMSVLAGRLTWFWGGGTVGMAKDLFATRIGSDKADDTQGDSDAPARAIP